MSFAGKVWRLLVGIKDGLVLLFMILFFMGLYAILTTRPSPGQVHGGALLLDLDGSVVEEASETDPLQVLLSQEMPAGEYQARDLVRAIDAAATDDRIKAVVLDLSRFVGGGQVHLAEIGASLDRVRAAKKPVLAFANAYVDDGMMLAAHASEVWVDPMGGAVVAGPGGDRLYYGGLLDRLKVNAHVFRVGTYKAAVEPFIGGSMSPEAREDASNLYGALWEEWKADVKKARPAANLAQVTGDPVAWLAAARGNSALAAKQAGLVDKIGDRVAFGNRVAKIVGPDSWNPGPGSFAYTELAPWLAANKPDKSGKAIGVVTIAGEIVDGDAGPGQAGGDRIADLLDDALNDDLAGLVVRVDSPGGSVMASEEIRRAILRHKARKIPVAVSMGNLAASGGYWVSTPAERIFAEPETITGSIGIFAVVPTFENALGQWGVTTDGVKTTPLSGQPDLAAGLTPETEAMIQGVIENGYAQFLTLVSKSRGKTPEQVNEIAQGRVWAGGPARQIGLVDQFGGLDDALAWTAQKAGLKKGEWHAKFLGSKPDAYHSLLQALMGTNEAGGQAPAKDLVALLSSQQADLTRQLSADLDRLTTSRGAEAYCLICPRSPQAGSQQVNSRLVRILGALSRD
ncbi:signal peptide peptidase SppA [Croceicoccus estronivorus]|uniref:signal peptide peptidase SppA n=1 Tax=Croceicoccus estronivorus TaxID=1172626 RepID=UPI00083328FC|nr:signal peptide peptidase SppA [Croceicoccus estronivorus]OCC25292.1 signal peptide peptidase SppA [Croceicoccus estronivorus]